MQSTDFDYAQLDYEKAFLFNEDESIITHAINAAFKINVSKIRLESFKNSLTKEMISECNHDHSKTCSRDLIFDANFFADTCGSSTSFGLSMNILVKSMTNTQYQLSM
ncbi:12649_t:CDS:1 [Dentiscutata erythropus]|uniref:12649_t:CDS:1 n=1 Tax=Dentiscutata erythropus TaxID=1348616 RepID=A0A9N9BRV1_9GLOM|nr:12649_t:CDS:1 [Dentiscutata erythropus]